MKKITEVGFGWSTSAWSPLSIGIRYFSRPRTLPWPMGKWSHMFLVFRFSDGSVVIHEALGSGGWQEKRIQKLTEWINKAPGMHKAELYWLPLSFDTAARIYAASSAMLDKASYAWKQIAACMVSGSMIGRWLMLSVAESPKDVICSEGACRLVGTEAPPFDLRENRCQSWDSVTPQAAYNEFMKKADHFGITKR